jgi:hypothetical protein
MGKRARWVLIGAAEIICIFALLILFARVSFFSGILPERTAHALRCLSDPLFGIEVDGSLKDRLAYAQRDAETERTLLLARARIENYFALFERHTLSIARHPYIQELFQNPRNPRVYARAEDFIERIALTYLDIDEVILGRGQEITARGTYRFALPYPKEGILPHLAHLNGREPGAAIFPVQGMGMRFLFLAPVQASRTPDTEYTAVMLNANMIRRFLNSHPLQGTQGIYLAYGDDRRNWLSASATSAASGENPLAAQFLEREAALEQYKTERFIEFGEERFRNISLSIQFSGTEDILLLGVLEGEIKGAWYLPFLLEGAFLLFSVLVLIHVSAGILSHIRRAPSPRRQDKAQDNTSLERALEQSQENCKTLIENSKKLVHQAVRMQSHVRKVSLPAIDVRLQSNLLMSAEPEIERLRRLIDAPPPADSQGRPAEQEIISTDGGKV